MTSPEDVSPANKRARLDEPSTNASSANGRAIKSTKPSKQMRKGKQRAAKVDEVLYAHAVALLGGRARFDDLVETAESTAAPFEHLSEIEVDITELSSHGDGLAITDDWIVAVPFCLPGERVLARIYRSDIASRTSYADLVRVLRADTTQRDDSLVRCKYFGNCGGCQYQMLPYERQLEIKRDVVDRAYRFFSGLDPALIPPAQPTLASPAQYAYRTKLTPHFNAPRNRPAEPDVAIGFEVKGRRHVLDIEECPISTQIVQDGLKRERERVRRSITTFKRDTPYCETNHKQIIRERVAGKDFEFVAGEFFQCNNGILESLVAYARSQIPARPPPSDPSHRPRFLVDAYCGAGLFGICLADSFDLVSGIEISAESVRFATHNATLNGVTNASFVQGDAQAIFREIEFPNAQTTVLIDPPRKGCDQPFLDQLMTFSPAHVIYVSCNVHTQARDVGILVRDGGYRLDSLRGADLFPQTHHVESVAVLSRPS